MPHKPRFFEGTQLPDFLYPCQHGVENRWRYAQANRSMFPFSATLDEAIAFATHMNQQRAAAEEKKRLADKDKGPFCIHADKYITGRERRDPSLTKKQSWINRRYGLRHCARWMDERHITPGWVTLANCQEYWDELTGHVQRYRKCEFRLFFSYLAGKDLLRQIEHNPFALDMTFPVVEMRAKPGRKRQRLDLPTFVRIHERAGELGYPFLQVAMQISLSTTMRRGDLCSLQTKEHLVGHHLRKQISKSHAMLSDNDFAANPSNLEFDLKSHPILRKAINQARELALKNGACPFVLSHTYIRKQPGPNREHRAQVQPEYLTRAFSEVRDDLGIGKNDAKATRPTFHEVRALGGHLLEKAGYSTKDIQILMAHTDEKMTRHYLAGHETAWTAVSIALTEDMLTNTGEK